MALILASGSPRRRELLGLITNDFTVCVSGAEENVPADLTPAETVEALSRLKGRAVLAEHPADIVIASDTVVAVDGKILGKPASRQEVCDMLRLLSGKTHEVFTGVYIAGGGREEVFHDRTEVTFYALTETEIERYADTGEPFDKAGAYGIQGKGALLVEGIKGDYYNVMGFPVAKAARALEKFGIR